MAWRELPSLAQTSPMPQSAEDLHNSSAAQMHSESGVSGHGPSDNGSKQVRGEMQPASVVHGSKLKPGEEQLMAGSELLEENSVREEVRGEGGDLGSKGR